MKFPRWTGLLVLVLVFSVSCELTDPLRRGDAPLVSGDTVNILDIVKGDELVVEKAGRHFRVRMIGIQAFDSVIADPYLDKYGKAATTFLAQHRGNAVQIFFEATSKDPHGRYLAYVHLNDVDLNRQMVQDGLVPVYTEFNFGREPAYLEAERAARRLHQGIWNDDKTPALIAGLRKQWKAARHVRGDKPPTDPLL